MSLLNSFVLKYFSSVWTGKCTTNSRRETKSRSFTGLEQSNRNMKLFNHFLKRALDYHMLQLLTDLKGEVGESVVSEELNC